MPYRTLRTIGASVVLAALGLTGIAQVVLGREEPPSEIVADETTTTMAETSTSLSAVSTTASEPFVYRVGVLSGVSTDNFWAFYGDQPSVWNSYVLGPTKPALFTSSATLGRLQPELAVSQPEPESDDGTWSVRVDLDARFTWSDGTPITAHDLVFTFETVRELGLGGSWVEAFPESVESVRAAGDHQVVIEFSERPQLSVWPHGVGLAPIMPEHVWASEVDGGTAQGLYELSGAIDVGGGPLAITSVSDELMTATANPGYPNGVVPDTVEYHVFSDEQAAVAALSGGEIDSILSPKGLAGDDLAALESEPGIELLTNPANAIRYLGFNLDREPMSDRAFRVALAKLLDRESLAATIPNTGPMARSVIPQANEQWFDEEAAAKNAARFGGPLVKRLQSAIKVLEAAGYAWEKAPSISESGELVAGTGLTIEGRTPPPLTILTPGDEYDPARPDYVEEIASTLGVLGFDARPVETDFDTVVDLAFTPADDGTLQYDMYMLGWTLGNPALPGYYRALFAADGAMNNTGYKSADFASALKRYEDASTVNEAFEALWDMERELAKDLPYLPLYSNQISEAYRSDRVEFDLEESLGGLQGRLGGIRDVQPAG